MIRRASIAGVPIGTQPRTSLSNLMGSVERHPVSRATPINTNQIVDVCLIAASMAWVSARIELESGCELNRMFRRYLGTAQTLDSRRKPVKDQKEILSTDFTDLSVARFSKLPILSKPVITTYRSKTSQRSSGNIVNQDDGFTLLANVALVKELRRFDRTVFRHASKSLTLYPCPLLQKWSR